MDHPTPPAPGIPGAPGAPGVSALPAGEREVADVETLKALADPLRLAILRVLTGAGPEPLAVKEIAAALGEAPSKLYRHIRQLEQTGLITVAATRLVSGILESRYLAAQRSLRLSREFLGPSAEHPEALDALLAAIDAHRAEFRAAALAGRIDLGSPAAETAGPTSAFAHATLRLAPDRQLELTRRLRSVLAEFRAEEESTSPDAVEVTLFSLLYAARAKD
ncbi:transcriptional regulator [Kitasatospora sp. MMS16-BH015]|uniref:ArsR/SmtB family transcription factor n=1 Tax=Kitasatospora sp. MMS16-BH015 TaxID=2018025 RepID=UPI000CF1DE56|nr:helix-turn-helix domain-containing protein [Kitasatospora sp. MMS16-BH015]